MTVQLHLSIYTEHTRLQFMYKKPWLAFVSIPSSSGVYFHNWVFGVSIFFFLSSEYESFHIGDFVFSKHKILIRT